MDYGITFIDAGAVALVMAIVQIIKSRFRIGKRWVPLLPWPIALVIGFMVVVAAYGWPVGKEAWYQAIDRTMIEMMKVAFASMGVFKLLRTTVLGQGENNDNPA